MDQITKLAVIGSGALSQAFCRQCMRSLPSDYIISSVMARHIEHAQALAQELDCFATDNIEDLLEDNPDIVIEIAGIPAVKQYAFDVLDCGADLVIVSVGALADEKFLAKLRAQAHALKRRVYVVNGAIGGFDLMNTIALMGTRECSITSLFPTDTLLQRVPSIKDKLSTTEEEVIFSGSVKEAAQRFPQRLNVAVGVSLAADCPNTTVTIRNAPQFKHNHHEIDLKGDLVRAHISVNCLPDPNNTQSSAMAAWSIIALLKNLADPIRYF